MQFSNLSALSLSALKALANSNNAIPVGDKRSKQAWIDALELLAAETTIYDLPDSEMECFAVAVDVWVAPEMPSEAEQEAISHAADNCNSEEPELSVIDYGDIPQSKSPSSKPGAISVIAMLLCAIIAVIQAAIVIGCAIGKLVVYSRSILTNETNWYQIYSQQRGLDIACA